MSFSPHFNKNKSPFDADQATFSNYLAIKTTHIDLDWQIDWKKELIHGSATLSMEAIEEVKEIVLDVSYLDIETVEVDGKQAVCLSSAQKHRS
jgi:leukotriene-A4 hydrolase